MTLAISRTNPFANPIKPVASIAKKTENVETSGTMAFKPGKTLNTEQAYGQMNKHFGAMANYNMAMIAMQGSKGTGMVGTETSGTTA